MMLKSIKFIFFIYPYQQFIVNGIITPYQLYKIVDHVVEFYMNDNCLVIISTGGGYMPPNHIPKIYVDPYNEKEFVQNQNSSLSYEEYYKIFIIAPVLELGCTGYIVQTENPAEQIRMIEKTFVHVNQRNERRFIFIPSITSVNKKSIKIIQDEISDLKNFDFKFILKEKSLRYIPNVIFTLPNDYQNRVELFTHRFAGSDKLSSQEILLDIYNLVEDRFELGANLFPDKVKDLEGKILKVALFHYPPYSVIIENNDNIEVDGTEWRFAVEFAKLHNSSLEEVVDNEGEWGHIYENLTGEGVTGNLVEDKADLGMTALYSWHYESLFLDLAAPYYRSGITCLVPGPRQVPQWMSPILPFNKILWLSFIVMTIVSAIFTLVINRAESSWDHSKGSSQMSFTEAALTIAGITFLQGLNKNPKGPSWSALSITLLIVSVLVATAYGSSLASAITVPRYENPIDTALELATKGIPWGATHHAWIFSIVDAEEPEMRTLVKNFQKRSAAELARHSREDDNWAFTLERLQSGHYSVQDYISRKAAEKMHLMRSDIYWEYCVSMLRKSSPLTKWYSYRVLEIQASGIPAYWEADVTRLHSDSRKQLAVHEEYTEVRKAPVKMTAYQVQGTFFILIIGLVLSTLVFIGELYTTKNMKKKEKKEGRNYTIRRE